MICKLSIPINLRTQFYCFFQSLWRRELTGANWMGESNLYTRRSGCESRHVERGGAISDITIPTVLQRVTLHNEPNANKPSVHYGQYSLPVSGSSSERLLHFRKTLKLLSLEVESEALHETKSSLHFSRLQMVVIVWRASGMPTIQQCASFGSERYLGTLIEALISKIFKLDSGPYTLTQKERM